MMLIPHVFYQCLTLYFILSQTQRAAEHALGSPGQPGLGCCHETPFTLGHPKCSCGMPVSVLSLVSLHDWMQSKPVAWKARTASNKAPELTRAKAQCPPLCPRTLQTLLAAKLLSSVFFGGGGQCEESSRGRHTNPFRFTPQVRFVALKFTGRMSPLMPW